MLPHKMISNAIAPRWLGWKHAHITSKARLLVFTGRESDGGMGAWHFGVLWLGLMADCTAVAVITSTRPKWLISV